MTSSNINTGSHCMIKDYKYLVNRKKEKMVPESLVGLYAFFGCSGWLMCIYIL